MLSICAGLRRSPSLLAGWGDGGPSKSAPPTFVFLPTRGARSIQTLMDEGGEASRCELSAQPMDVSFHPSMPILAAGLITGGCQVFQYAADSSTPLTALAPHKESCRAIRFDESGALLLSASVDKSILATDVSSGKPVARLENAHPSGINRLINLEGPTIASGDDDGCIRIWDTRQQQHVAEFKDAHEDFVSDMEYVAGAGLLLGAGGDGRLSVCNVRRGKVEHHSDEDDDELLSVVSIKGGKKVVVGSQQGVLGIFSWGYWNGHSDRFPGHPMSVDTIVKIDEDTIFTGSSDGLIRVVQVIPNKMLGVVGEHMDYPIERIALSHDGNMLASASHDNTVKLWDVSYLRDAEGGGAEGGEEGEGAAEAAAAAAASAAAAGAASMAAAAAAEAEASDSEEDEMEEEKTKKKKKKGKKGKLNKAKGPNFFSDIL